MDERAEASLRRLLERAEASKAQSDDARTQLQAAEELQRRYGETQRFMEDKRRADEDRRRRTLETFLEQYDDAKDPWWKKLRERQKALDALERGSQLKEKYNRALELYESELGRDRAKQLKLRLREAQRAQDARGLLRLLVDPEQTRAARRAGFTATHLRGTAVGRIARITARDSLVGRDSGAGAACVGGGASPPSRALRPG